MIKVLPSTNPCNEDDLVDYVRSISDLGIEYIHCDVMDGNFVENKCLPFELVEKIKNNVNILLDIHLMVDDVVGFVKHFASVKPSIITIHYEAPKSTREILKVIKYLKKRDILVGLSIKPNTPIEIIERFLDYIDLILIMSVEPGKSGQKFIDDTYEKVKKAKELIKGKDILIEIDGGINVEIAQKLKNLGCDFLVMGSAFYNEKEKSKLLNSIDKHYIN